MKEYLQQNDPALLMALTLCLSGGTLQKMLDAADEYTAELRQEVSALENQILEQGEQ
jgi:hypothetical protein